MYALVAWFVLIAPTPSPWNTQPSGTLRIYIIWRLRWYVRGIRSEAFFTSIGNQFYVRCSQRNVPHLNSPACVTQREEIKQEDTFEALESCIRVLLTKNCIMKMRKLCEKARVSEELMATLLDRFPGILVKEEEKKGHDGREKVKIELAPAADLMLCQTHIDEEKGTELSINSILLRLCCLIVFFFDLQGALRKVA